jgi:CheY-like chemotaxis protein
MTVEVCESGARAIELCKSKTYDIVFLDHMMPDMDGVEALGHIRKLAEQSGYYSDSPIMALTANALTGMREMYIESGFTDFLAKPIEMPKLSALLATWIAPDKQTASDASQPREIPDNRMAILEVFADDIKKKALQIPQALDSGDMKLFATYVHALKSASANVGESKLSEMAAALESAAKKDNRRYIEENFAAFMSEMHSVSERAGQVALGAAEESAEIPPEMLAKLKTALEDYDISTIDELTAQIKNAELSRFVLAADYDGAVEVINKLM